MQREIAQFERISRLSRKTSFSKAIALDEQLVETVRQVKSNEVLANPALQNVYLSLVDYLCDFASQWFDRPIQQLRILDWGCGKGHITFLLRRHQAQVISADRSDNSEDSAFGQETPLIQQFDIQVIGLEHDYLLPFEDESFDIVLSFGVLEHVPNDKASLQEIHRILKSNGLFYCFFLPYTFSWTQRLQHMLGNYYHDRLYGKRQVRKMLSHNGLQLIDIWHRQLLPKNSVNYVNYRLAERVDQWLTSYTWLKFLATNIEFVAAKSSVQERLG